MQLKGSNLEKKIHFVEKKIKIKYIFTLLGD